MHLSTGLKFGGIAVVAIVFAVGAWFALAPREIDLQSADATDPELVDLGRKIYVVHCAQCHGIALEGQPNWRQRLPDGNLPAPPHDETGHTWHHADQVLFEITKYGRLKNAPPSVRGSMPSFDERLSNKEIWASLAYIKSHWPKQILVRQQSITTRYRAD